MKFAKTYGIIASIFAFGTASVAVAATPTYSGLNTITNVVAYQSGIVMFTIGAAPSSPWATCNLNHQFAINTTTVSGQALFQTILTAEQQKKNVYVVGLGTCNALSAVEDVNYVQINP